MKRIVMLIFVVVMAVGLMTACGGSSTPSTPADPPSSPSSDGDTSAPAASGDLETIIGVVPRTVEVLEDTAFWAAEKMGYFADRGYTLEMQQSFGTTDVKMVATDNADVCFPSPSFVLASIEEGIPIKGICQYGARNIFGFAVLSDNPISTWDDLKGHSIALGDAAWQQIMAPDLVAAGLDPDNDVEWVVAGENRFIQVAEGMIDVLFTWEGEFYQLEAQGFDFIYHSADPIRPCASNPIVANLDMIDKDPGKLQAFVRGFQMGLYFVFCSPEASADISLERFPAIDITWDGAVAVQHGIVAQNLGSTPADQALYMNPIGRFYDDKWQMNVDAALAADIITASIPLDRIYSMDFVMGGISDEDKARVEDDAKNYQYAVKDKYQ